MRRMVKCIVPKVMGSCCLITEEEVAAAFKGLNIIKAAGPTDVVCERIMASGDRINNNVKEGCIPDEWRNIIPVPVCRGEGK